MLSMGLRRVLLGIVASAGTTLAIGCGGGSPPGETYYQRNVEPVLISRCSGTTSGCHKANIDDPYQFAAGNFDVTSFANVQKRRDVLDTFGAYPYPLLLIKAVGPGLLQVAYGSNFPNIDVQHSGGPIIELGSDEFFTLQAWLENGATENGLPPATPAQTGSGTCSDVIPSGFSAAMYESNASYAQFKSTVQPVLTAHNCSAGSCHGAPESDFYITCGTSEDEIAFNFSQAWSFVANPVADSQILRVPLAVSAGGRGHTGGDQFSSTTDPDYVSFLNWATAVGPLAFASPTDLGRQFFADNVQPLLLQRGCSFEACHSPTATNDFKLRTGTQGFFSAIALERNYELLKDNFMALEFPDARRGRAVAKTVLSGDPRVASVGGIVHRGGPVLETPSASMPADPGPAGSLCPTPATYSATSTPPPTAFCTVQVWIDIERAALLTAGTVTPMDDGDAVNVVYVERDPTKASAGRLEFDTYQGGADLKVASTTFTGGYQHLSPIDVSTGMSLLTGCPGFTGSATADVQAPDVANDGVSVVFAMRNSASDPLGVYEVNINGTGCTRLTLAQPASSDGIMIHNFDPAWAPDGSAIVFASTRGGTGGPVRSRKRFLPASDLWRMNPDGSSPTQMTFLSNSEVTPQFMREGRVTMTTEKVSDGFYQLSGRRINWDITDYHPLLAQRDAVALREPDGSDADESVDRLRRGDRHSRGQRRRLHVDLARTSAATAAPVLPGARGCARDVQPQHRSVRGGPHRRRLSAVGAHHRGQRSRIGATAAQLSRAVLSAGRARTHGSATRARSPGTWTGGPIDCWDIYSINPHDRQPSAGCSPATTASTRVDAVLAYKYPARTLYQNHRQLVFGGSVDSSDTAHAVLYMPDAPMVFTLLTGNLRRGRPVDAFRGAQYLAVYSEGKTPMNTMTGNTDGIYQMRMLLGRAPLASDGSVRAQLPSGTGVVLELQDGSFNPIVTMGEEHQLGPGEQISMGVGQPLFNAVCAAAATARCRASSSTSR